MIRNIYCIPVDDTCRHMLLLGFTYNGFTVYICGVYLYNGHYNINTGAAVSR